MCARSMPCIITYNYPPVTSNILNLLFCLLLSAFFYRLSPRKIKRSRCWQHSGARLSTIWRHRHGTFEVYILMPLNLPLSYKKSEASPSPPLLFFTRLRAILCRAHDCLPACFILICRVAFSVATNTMRATLVCQPCIV